VVLSEFRCGCGLGWKRLQASTGDAGLLHGTMGESSDSRNEREVFERYGCCRWQVSRSLRALGVLLPGCCLIRSDDVGYGDMTMYWPGSSVSSRYLLARIRLGSTWGQKRLFVGAPNETLVLSNGARCAFRQECVPSSRFRLLPTLVRC
jgi:hypothetical protein